jgi:acylphosphatase
MARAPGAGTAEQPDLVRLTAKVQGMVQGVGFRYWTSRQAHDLHLTGTVQNRADGSVLIEAEGTRAEVEELLRRLRSSGAPGSVTEVSASFSDAQGNYTGFRATG